MFGECGAFFLLGVSEWKFEFSYKFFEGLFEAESDFANRALICGGM